MNKIIIISSLLFLSLQISGQTYSQFRQSADTAFYSHKDYYNADRFYSILLEFNGKDSIDLFYQLAQSNRLGWNLEKASRYYNRVIHSADTLCYGPYNKSYYFLGEVYQRTNQYDSALYILDTLYGSECEGESERLDELVSKLVESCLWAKRQEGQKTKIWAVEDINTPDHEVAPLIRGDQVIYSSMKYHTKECKEDFIHQVADIMRYDSASGEQVYNLNLRKERGDTSISYLTMNQEGTKIFYSVCYNLSTSELRCRIVSRQVFPNDSLGPEVPVLGKATNELYTYTQPHIGIDIESGAHTLFFVSDRPGGKGGLDIWYGSLTEMEHVIYKNEVTNLASVNTKGNELSPYYDGSKSLYFSTDHVKDSLSYGGYDIFKAKLIPNTRWKFSTPMIMKKPINSSKNDLFYVPSSTEGAWFTSNRNDAYDISTNYSFCCYDLFQTDCMVTYVPAIYNSCTYDTIIGAEVFLLDLTATPFKRIEPVNGQFRVHKDKKYRLEAHLDGYDKGVITVTAGGRECDSTFGCDVFLEPIQVSLKVFTQYSCEPGGPLLPLKGCTIRLTNNDRETVEINAGEMDSVVFSVFPLSNYVLEVSHPYFGIEQKSISIPARHREHCDVIEIIDLTPHPVLLPDSINLYFANDIPGPQNRFDTIADRAYWETWEIISNGDTSGYSSSNVYRQYQSRFGGNLQTQEAISQFFRRARTQVGKYNRFKKQLSDFLSGDSGNIQEIILRMEGRASPLASSEYNLALSKRRINSIMKDMRQDTVLANAFDERRIQILPSVARGDNLSQGIINDDPSNTRLSIYDPRAAQQRRITIWVDEKLCEKLSNL